MRHSSLLLTHTLQLTLSVTVHHFNLTTGKKGIPYTVTNKSTPTPAPPLAKREINYKH